MKIGLAIQQVRSAESDLAEELERVGERHKTDQEIYHLTRTLASISRRHIEELARFQERYPISGGAEGGDGEPGLLGTLREKGSELVDSVSEGPGSGEGGRRSGVLDTVREKGSELVGRRPESGLLLLHDLRELYMLASETSISWVILGQVPRRPRTVSCCKLLRIATPTRFVPSNGPTLRSRRPLLRY
jgi:hypothetical protein